MRIESWRRAARAAHVFVGNACVFAVALAAGLFGKPSSATEAASYQPVDAAIVFAVDKSSSIDPLAAKLQRDGHVAALRSDAVGRAIASGPSGCIAASYVEWSSVGEARTVLPWTRLCNSQDAELAAEAILENGDDGRERRGRGRTSVSFAVDLGSMLLDLVPWPATRKIIDLSANGTNNDGVPVWQSRQRALEKGRIINVIAVTGEEPGVEADLAGYFEREVIGGPGAFVITPATAQDYARAIERKLVMEVSGYPFPGNSRVAGLKVLQRYE